MERDTAYLTLSDLIFKGFLTAEMSIDGRSFIFKTINDKEFDLIKMYTGDPKVKGYQVRFNTYCLIFSLLVMNNENILMNRERNVRELYNFFMGFPEKLFSKILNDLNTLRLYAFESLKFIEGFSYTDLSRNSWKSLNGYLPSASEFTGVAGTSEMGLNIFQESWVLINRSLDDEEQFNREFSMALMISSSMNPKGARSIRSCHDSTMKMAEDRRKKLAKTGFIDNRKWSAEGWAAPVDTVEELVAELEREMTGVKDKHDLFIEGYMKKMRDQAEKKTKEAEDRIKKIREGQEEAFIDGSQRILTPEESRALFNKKQPTLQTAMEENVTEEDRNKFYKKIGARVLTGR